eukprot:g5535.t1
MSSNFEKLQKLLKLNKPSKRGTWYKRKHQQQAAKAETKKEDKKKNKRQLKRESESQTMEKKIKGVEKPGIVTDIVAMDCEMVGVSKSGKDDRSVLARATVVNFDGDVLYDRYVVPMEKVTYYRTHVSGVSRENLYGKKSNAVSFKQAQAAVASLINGRILVGHALHNDLAALMLDHPKSMTRDTAKYKPMLRARANGRRARPKALRQLTKELLGVQIQDGAHSPVIDARAALELYKKYRKQWENNLKMRAKKSKTFKGRKRKIESDNSKPNDSTMNKKKKKKLKSKEESLW